MDHSILDVPCATPPDPETYLRAALAWHFGTDTGSPFWLRMATRLDFDPLSDIRTYDDLGMFPNLVDELRDVPVEDLTAGGFVPGAGLLCMMPSGPHGVGHFDRVVAERLGSTCYAIDLDPRWVKKVAARSDRRAAAVVTDYVDHVLEQARHILESQRVGNLHATPPLLEAIANNDHLLGLVNRRIRYILLSGAHVDVDTMDLFRGIFPDSAIAIAFGNTMILSQAATRTDGESIVFDPRSPYVVIWVIDPATGERVPYGERGQVVMHHLSKGMFIPGNLERDTAIRRPGPDGQIGDSVSEVAPVSVFDGEPVIEGVY